MSPLKPGLCDHICDRILVLVRGKYLSEYMEADAKTKLQCTMSKLSELYNINNFKSTLHQNAVFDDFHLSCYIVCCRRKIWIHSQAYNMKWNFSISLKDNSSVNFFLSICQPFTVHNSSKEARRPNKTIHHHQIRKPAQNVEYQASSFCHAIKPRTSIHKLHKTNRILCYPTEQLTTNFRPHSLMIS